jgi:YMGG-like Gly-zipper
MRPNRASALAMVLALAAAPTLAKDFFIYAQKGQSAEQQEADEFECLKWAKQQSGFDPMNAASTTTTATGQPPQVSEGGTVKGAARGAAVGAIGGAIAGDAGKGAAIGAGTGAAVGTMRRRDAERRQATEQQQRQQQARSSSSAAHASFNRAYTACMEGRGYTVK